MNNIKVLYENENLLVIDKPSGVVVNRAITHSLATVQDFIEENIDSEAQPADDEVSDYQSRSGVVHRLDKDTSGALLVAKNVKTFEALQKQFKDRTIKKEYVAIAIGKITDEKIANIEIKGFPVISESTAQFIKTVFLVRNFDGLNCVFLGHISENLPPAVADNLTGADLLFLPLGGHYLSSAAAVSVVKKLEPRIIIPAFFDSKIIPDFTKELGQKSVSPESKLTLKSKDLPSSGFQLVLLKTA